MEPSPARSRLYESVALYDASIQIRFLQIRPKTAGEHLCFDLTVHALKNAPRYHAISYTWGANPEQKTIFINGVAVSVRDNCHYALCQAQSQSPLYLWIDSICIDQHNLDEKSLQVATMWDIYHEAAQVLACIGRADMTSDRLLQTLDELDVVGDFEDGTKNAWVQWLTVQGNDGYVQVCEDYNQLCERPYFSRLWEAQELHAGETRGVQIMLGSRALPWNFLDDLYDVLIDTSTGRSGVKPSRKISTLYNLMSKRHTSTLSALKWALDLLCTDPRDRIYGLLRPLALIYLKPDYRKSALDLALELATRVGCSVSTLATVVAALRIYLEDIRLLHTTLSGSFYGVESCETDKSFHLWRWELNAFCVVDTIGSNVTILESVVRGRDKVPQNHLPASGPGLGSSSGNYHCFMVPPATRVGSVVLHFPHHMCESYLVLHFMPNSTDVVVIGTAEKVSSYVRPAYTEETALEWNMAGLDFEATGEQMISLLAPRKTAESLSTRFTCRVGMIRSIVTWKKDGLHYYSRQKRLLLKSIENPVSAYSLDVTDCCTARTEPWTGDPHRFDFDMKDTQAISIAFERHLQRQLSMQNRIFKQQADELSSTELQIREGHSLPDLRFYFEKEVDGL